MKGNTIYITTATIRFYKQLYLFPNSGKYTLTIKLEDCPPCCKNNRIYIPLHDSPDISDKLAHLYRRHFALNNIFNTSKVAIIFDDDGIIAIGTNGADNYLDIRNNFKVKKFAELGINISSLIITA